MVFVACFQRLNYSTGAGHLIVVGIIDYCCVSGVSGVSGVSHRVNRPLRPIHTVTNSR